MNKLSTLLFGMLLLAGTQIRAQLQTPAPSPSCKMTQTVGLTDVTVEYSRPSVKGRDIFSKDGLVPFGQMWRTGANKNTMVTFSDDVKVGGTEVKKGTYAIFTKPDASEWTVYLYTDTENWGVPEKWDDEKVAAKVMVKPKKMDISVESFLVNIGNLRTNSAELELIWDHTLVEVPIEVDVDSKVMGQFEKMLAGPTGSDYYRMASYYHETGKEAYKALEYVDKAIADNPKFWMVRKKSEILADMGRYDEAIESAKKSLKMAQDAGNMDYVRINEKNIAEWSKK